MDKKIKVTIDGIEMEVSVSEEELAKLTEKNQKNTGYERVLEDVKYYTVLDTGEVDYEDECCSYSDNDRYETANYYTDKTLAKNNARADQLMRQLRRFAAEHCNEVEWDTDNAHYCIVYSHLAENFDVNRIQYMQDVGQIYFDTEDNAERAIDTFKDDLLWYFTEYRNRV